VIFVMKLDMFVASRLGRRPKRLKEMQLAAAAAAAAVIGTGGNMSVPSCASSTDQHLEMSSAAMRRLCMSSSTVNSSLDVADVHAELQVHSFNFLLLHCIYSSVTEHIVSIVII